MGRPFRELERLARDGSALGGPRMILAGDVGGTKTHLALYEPGRPLRLVRLETYHSAAFPSLDAVIDQFRPDDTVPVTAAALGVAGPIVGPMGPSCRTSPGRSTRRGSRTGSGRRMSRSSSLDLLSDPHEAITPDEAIR